MKSRYKNFPKYCAGIDPELIEKEDIYVKGAGRPKGSKVLKELNLSKMAKAKLQDSSSAKDTKPKKIPQKSSGPLLKREKKAAAKADEKAQCKRVSIVAPHKCQKDKLAYLKMKRQ